MDLFRFYERKARECEKGLWASDTGEGRAAPTAPPDVVEPLGKDQDEVIVYITKTGKKYHRESCRWLSRAKIATPLEQAKKRGYTPCKTCKPPR